jgi:hypothetical protein
MRQEPLHLVPHEMDKPVASITKNLPPRASRAVPLCIDIRVLLTRAPAACPRRIG